MSRAPRSVCCCSRWAIANGDTCIKCGKLLASAYGKQEKFAGYKLLLASLDRYRDGRSGRLPARFPNR
jgi:hypothetical protein